jgi:hypothetical protein
MNETIIKEVESHKHLGLFFHEDGNWHVHVNHIIDKVTPYKFCFEHSLVFPVTILAA